MEALHQYPHLPPCHVTPFDRFPSPPCPVLNTFHDPEKLPHYEDLFPPAYNPFSCMPPALITPYIPPIISSPLDPPPSYHSLFPSSESSDSDEALQDPWEDPYGWNIDSADSDWD